MSIQNNIGLLNANNRYKVNTGKKAKSSEKLSSGYRLNRAADDAAGVAISEKMRAQIRGLNSGTKNVQDGISWVQIGDGALSEVHEMLQRMRELTIQSLNDTNSDADRAACQAEFDALQSAIDNITEETEFNTQKVFDEHELPYYQCVGNVGWDQAQTHIVASDKNDLIITYRPSEADPPKEVKIEVPAGSYTTQELMDEIEDAAIASGIDKEGLMIDFTQDGTCNLNLEGGEVIDAIGGGLAYLFYDMYSGGGFGALIGTTVFINENVRLEVKSPNNNQMSFLIEDFNGNSQQMDITIPDGDYTRQELIDLLNVKLQGTDVSAVAYGTGIKLEGQNSIVTGFKGNMFKIDDGSKVYHSVFYDNVNYGNITMDPAYFTGGAVKPTDSSSEEFQNFVIDSSNNQLILKPNGAATETVITIPEDTYTVSEMKDKLNELFAANNLELDVTEHESSGYKGLKITSRIEGVTSSIGIDRTSTAYDTLFTTRQYNSVTKVYPQSDTNADRDAYIWSPKDLSTGLEITAANDKFQTVVRYADGSEAQVDITLSQSANSSLSQIVSQIQSQLDNQLGAGKVKVEDASGHLRIIGEPGSGVTNINANAIAGNSGYEDLFVKKTENSTYGTLTGTTVTLPDVPTGGLDNTNNKMDLVVGGVTHSVTLPTGNPTQDEIIAAIENAIKEQVITTDNTFNRVTGNGTSTDRNFDVRDTGNTTVYTKSYTNQGSSREVEGAPGVYVDNIPATVTMQYAVPATMTVDDSCNNLQLNVNGRELSLTIENGTYTAAQLVGKVQAAVDNAFGAHYGGAVVSLDADNKLVFTARLTYADGFEGAGGRTSISCSTGTSTFLKKLHTVDSPASVTSETNVLSNMVINDQNNAFAFTLNGQNTSVTLPNGIYATPAALVTELNRAFDQAGHKVTASLSNGKLCLTTDEVGDQVSIAFDSRNGGSSSLTIFGDLTREAPAEITINRDVQENITIDGNSNQFVLNVNGNPETLTLTNGTYDRSSFLQMLNGHLAGKGVTATYSGNKLKLTTDRTGNTASLVMEYGTGGNSMKAIYGQTTTIIPGVDAEFTPDGKLVLKGTQNGTQIKAFAGDDNAFFKPTITVTPTNPTMVSGYASAIKSNIDGRNLTEPVTIDQYSNNLSFVYNENGTPYTVSLELPERDYTYAELTQALQNEIDADLGTGKLTVTVADSGMRIEAVNPGNKYTLSGFSGDFYNKIISTTRSYTNNLTPTVKYGGQNNDLAYTVGRKDIRNQGVLIRDGVNDTLSLDFTYGGNEITLDMELDPGAYTSAMLIEEIQKKLNEQLEAAGLEKNLIEAGIGGVTTGVSGANDNNALVFKLSDSVRLPVEGEYIIDGVRGNAAFSVFYQTEGELEPAYMGGTKDISNGVTIIDGENELSFKVDGVQYSVNIPTNDYTEDEIIDKLNELFTAQNIPAIAENYKGFVRLTYPSLGKHTISDVTGSAKEEVFFQENGATGERSGTMIQVTANALDGVEIERPLVNTSFLKINSIAITKPKYANKALDRLDYALSEISKIRSNLGSIQNRLEHAVNNNEISSENTQAAESRLRDADMAYEIMEHAKYSILQQATESVMAQSRMQAQNILKLLEM